MKTNKNNIELNIIYIEKVNTFKYLGMLFLL